MEIIKGNQLEMKNTLSEMKSILEGINRVDEKEDWTTNIEDGEGKDTQPKWQEKGKPRTLNQNGKKKRSQDYNNNLRSLWNKIKCKNVCVLAVSVEEEEQEVENIFEEIMMENFPNLVKEIDT